MPGRNGSQRLACFLVLSLAAHLLTLSIALTVRVVVPVPPASLEWVEWVPPPGTPPAASRPAAKPRRQAASPPRDASSSPEPVSAPVGEAEPAARLDMADLMARARAIARELTAPAAGTDPAAPPEAKPFLPALDRALNREPPGDHSLGHGLIRVVTRSGRAYCLQVPPEYARGGPVGMFAVPTSCP